jgi:hypothetical protein
MGEKRNAYRILVGKPEGKRPLGRPRCRWVYNIKMRLEEIGCKVLYCSQVAQDNDLVKTFGLHKRLGISLSIPPSASRVALGCMELVCRLG